MILPPKSGLLVSDLLFTIPGVEVIAPACVGGPSWATLSPRDYGTRKTPWIRQVIVHTTKGEDPQHVIPGVGPGGRDRVVADFWKGDEAHSGAQLVVDNDGSVVCLVDLRRYAAYHATVSNDWSIGIEMYQEAGGGVYEATLRSTVKLVVALCEIFEIPFQVPGVPYRGHPLRRMTNGGPDCVGIFGHRDNTERRGRGDPGDEIFARLLAAGAEGFDFEARADVDAWARRQSVLNHMGERLAVDGIAGPSTIAAMKRLGFRAGREILA